MTIIANHAHLMPAPAADSGWPAGDSDMLLAHLDACGIDRALVFAPFANQCGGSLSAANRWALREVRAHADRFIPAGTLNPLAADVLDVMQMCYDAGARWVKIHPSIDLHDIADPRLEDFYSRAEGLGMTLDYHTGAHGTRLSLAKPEKFDDLAWNHPKLRLVFEHLGGRAYLREFEAIIANHRGRVLGGLTSVYDPGVGYMWHIPPADLEAMIASLGASRFIFGLDFPWNDIEATKRDLRVIESLPLPASDKALILGGNLLRLLAETEGAPR
jgi:predicted TIM-barrel fold metal-dependent hydrolase